MKVGSMCDVADSRESIGTKDRHELPHWPVSVQTWLRWREVAPPRAEIDGCAAYKHRAVRPVVAAEFRADPRECPYCNP